MNHSLQQPCRLAPPPAPSNGKEVGGLQPQGLGAGCSGWGKGPLAGARGPAGWGRTFWEPCRSPGLPHPQVPSSPFFPAVRPGLWPDGFWCPLRLPLLCVFAGLAPNRSLARPSVLQTPNRHSKPASSSHRGDGVKNQNCVLLTFHPAGPTYVRV